MHRRRRPIHQTPSRPPVPPTGLDRFNRSAAPGPGRCLIKVAVGPLRVVRPSRLRLEVGVGPSRRGVRPSAPDVDGVRFHRLDTRQEVLGGCFHRGDD